MERKTYLKERELRRFQVLSLYEKKAIRYQEAAVALGVTARQFWRLWRRYREGGADALAHRLRGRPSPRTLAATTRDRIVELRTNVYGDFNDVHFTEKLNEVEGIVVGRETVRKLLRADGIPPKHSRRSPGHRSRRPPWPAEGALVQADASPHPWLGEEYIALVVAVDDATKKILYAHFERRETTVAYLKMLRQLCRRYGRPLALYADKHSIFQTNREPTIEEQLRGLEPATQFSRALQELNIHYIAANSPQAKGRIERAFRTLQDRLRAELRLANVADLNAANSSLRRFVPAYNRRFARAPDDPQPAWRPLPSDLDLDAVCALKDHRVVKPDNTISFHGRTLQIPPNPYRASYAKASVEVRELLNGQIRIYYQNRLLVSFPKTKGPAPDFDRIPSLKLYRKLAATSNPL
ncbi:MAG TPA: ISNCY family transposase [bacterium]|nr:ISNCY family transposase [bacterium]